MEKCYWCSKEVEEGSVALFYTNMSAFVHPWCHITYEKEYNTSPELFEYAPFVGVEVNTDFSIPCWICGTRKNPDDLYVSREFDCLVHKNCVKNHAKDATSSCYEEASIMYAEFFGGVGE